MFSHQFYNVVHIVGIVLIMAALGGMVSGAGSTPSAARAVWVHRVTVVFHGVGVFLILLGGFGMLARIGIVAGTSWPGWVWVKVVIWGALAISALLPYRFPRTALPLLLLLPLLGGTAAYMAIFKPL